MIKKTLCIISFVLIISIGFSQSNSFKYQAYLRKNNGVALSLCQLTVSVIIKNTNNILYKEIHNVSTSKWGVLDLYIGKGRVVQGSFNEIDWGIDTYTLEVEALDANNTQLFKGVSPIVKVPLSMYAQKSGDTQSLRNEVLLLKNKLKETQASNQVNMPKGTIIMYKGDTIPKGWAICNGENGTPNLINQFIKGTLESIQKKENHNIGYVQQGGGISIVNSVKKNTNKVNAYKTNQLVNISTNNQVLNINSYNLLYLIKL